MKSLSGLLLAFTLLSVQTAWSGTADELARKLGSVTRVSGDFVQEKTIEGLPAPLVSRGRFHYRRDTGLSWRTLEPVESSLTISPSGRVTMDNGRDAGLPAQVGTLFLAIFSGDYEQLRQWFRIEVTGGHDGWHMVLSPEADALADYLDRVTIAGGETVEQVRLEETNGDITQIQFATHTLEGGEPGGSD